MWTVAIDGLVGRFNPFPTRKDAIAWAKEWARTWPNHTYRAVKDPDFAPQPPKRRRRLKG